MIFFNFFILINITSHLLFLSNIPTKVGISKQNHSITGNLPIKFHAYTPLYFPYTIIHLLACQVLLSLSTCIIFNQIFVICPSNSIPIPSMLPLWNHSFTNLPNTTFSFSMQHIQSNLCYLPFKFYPSTPLTPLCFPYASLMKSFIYQLAQFYFLFQFTTYSMLERPLAIVKPHRHRHLTGNMPTIDLQETEPISPDIDILQQISWH